MCQSPQVTSHQKNRRYQVAPLHQQASQRWELPGICLGPKILRLVMTGPPVALALRSQWSQERRAFPVCRVTMWPCAPPILSTVYVLVTNRAPLYVCAKKMCLETTLVISFRTRKNKRKANEGHQMVIEHSLDTSQVIVWHRPRTTAILALRQDLNCLNTKHNNCPSVCALDETLSSFCILNCGTLGAHCDYIEIMVNMTLLNANATVKQNQLLTLCSLFSTEPSMCLARHRFYCNAHIARASQGTHFQNWVLETNSNLKNRHLFQATTNRWKCLTKHVAAFAGALYLLLFNGVNPCYLLHTSNRVSSLMGRLEPLTQNLKCSLLFHVINCFRSVFIVNDI